MSEEHSGLGPIALSIALQSLQIDPGSGGITYKLSDGSTFVGYLIATANVPLNGVAANRLWYSTNVTGQDFDLSVSTESPSTSGGLTYKAVPFGLVTSLPSHSGGWVIKRSGSVIGYSYYTGTTLNFVNLTSSADFQAGDSFQWSSSLSIPTQSTYYLAGCPQV